MSWRRKLQKVSATRRAIHAATMARDAAEIEQAARAAGLDYRHIPVAGGFGPDETKAMAEAIDQADGKVLAFCKSGTRSTYLWAMARASRGADGSDIISRAAEAGYDLTPIGRFLR